MPSRDAFDCGRPVTNHQRAFSDSASLLRAHSEKLLDRFTSERKNCSGTNCLRPSFFQQKVGDSENGRGIEVARIKPAMENNLEPLKFLTLEETAELLHLSRRTLQRMIHRKELPAFKVGGQWRVHPNQLAKWLEELEEL